MGIRHQSNSRGNGSETGRRSNVGHGRSKGQVVVSPPHSTCIFTPPYKTWTSVMGRVNSTPPGPTDIARSVYQLLSQVRIFRLGRKKERKKAISVFQLQLQRCACTGTIYFLPHLSTIPRPSVIKSGVTKSALPKISTHSSSSYVVVYAVWKPADLAAAQSQAWDALSSELPNF